MRLFVFVLLANLAAPAAVAFDLQGHRGARGLAPENTLAGFARALTIGVSSLELDVGVTRDGIVVVSHDRRIGPPLARRDGAWLAAPGPTVYSLAWADLGAYDVGRIDPNSRYARRFPDQVPTDGARIPRLADVFALVRRAGNGAVRFNIETKLSPVAPDDTLAPEPFAKAVVAAIRAAGMIGRASIQSFDWRTLVTVRRIAPDIPTTCLSAEQRWLDNILRGRPGPSPWTAGLDIDDAESLQHLVQQAGCATWSPYHRALSADNLARAHRLGLRVIPWTVNDPARMADLIALGVDGIITDYPDRLRAAMTAAGLPLPAPSPLAAD